MHFYFDGLSDEAVHVTGYGGEEFGVLQSDDVVLFETVFGHR
jgi:hypothetical protein